MKDIMINGKRTKLYAEAGSFLSMKLECGFGINNLYKISVTKNVDFTKSGTSYTVNKIYEQDRFIPDNKISAHIHTHPFSGGILTYIDKNGVMQYLEVEQGPTPRSDYPPSYQEVRNVIVDEKYIYLVNSDYSENKIFKRE